jgi:choline dehydrogenase
MHGTDGPVTVWRVEDWSAGDLAVMDAAVALGLERVDDINGAREQVPSVGPVPKNMVGYDRLNAALSYLRPIRQRPNLRIMAETTVDRVHFDGTRAAGVITTSGDRIDAGLVVLAAGAYFTPGILNRSGYGDAPDLERLGIPVRQHLPGVGKNLLDHPFAIGVIEGRIRPDAVWGEKLQGQAMVRSRSEGSVEIDCHIYDAQYFDEELGAWVISMAVSMVHARSTGTVSLTSTDPTAMPRIEHRHFSDPSDLERLCDGVEFATQLFRTAPLAGLSETLDARTWVTGDRDALRDLVRSRAVTTNHCSGTTRMGPATDPSAVVDGEGRVYGADGLVVADSSVFPTCPRANIHFAVVAAAEKIAAGLA